MEQQKCCPLGGLEGNPKSECRGAWGWRGCGWLHPIAANCTQLHSIAPKKPGGGGGRKGRCSRATTAKDAEGRPPVALTHARETRPHRSKKLRNLGAGDEPVQVEKCVPERIPRMAYRSLYNSMALLLGYRRGGVWTDDRLRLIRGMAALSGDKVGTTKEMEQQECCPLGGLPLRRPVFRPISTKKTYGRCGSKTPRTEHRATVFRCHNMKDRCGATVLRCAICRIARCFEA